MLWISLHVLIHLFGEVSFNVLCPSSSWIVFGFFCCWTFRVLCIVLIVDLCGLYSLQIFSFRFSLSFLFCNSVLVSYGFCNKSLQTRGLKMTQVYSLTALDAKFLKFISLGQTQCSSKALCPLKVLEVVMFPQLFQLLEQHSLLDSWLLYLIHGSFLYFQSQRCNVFKSLSLPLLLGDLWLHLEPPK